ncbi:GH3 auxin-responsive promoter family protein [Brucepastera parasyntrophica]|uniref:GH3 auxin-responsive promoter family protein n=1 Tax=Brucepastera parasyntrophica TaxID=2880008 RepID=UPI00210C4BC0|nr:GH3 auxin-responsive promoter family protein [Brucepastera parasyntrophica]ULQ59000.1 GH3 auxin-responsive promoter family protein [Brucepastera parasyntrophica]
MKEPKTPGAWKIKAGLSIVGKKGMRELNKASKNAVAAQEKRLRSTLETNKDTVYGKEHNFAGILKAKTAEELFDLYQKNVPINDYENLRPYVERHKHGEADVLFPGKPKMYATTSGTTSEPKWVPITQQYYDEVYNAMNRLWFYTLLKNKPKAFDGPAISIVGKAIEGTAPDGTVFGSISGVSQRDIPNFMKPIHTAPADVFHISDYKARYYAIMRMGIARDVHLIITANPSTLIEMQSNANEFYDDYVEDIEKGTISQKFDIPDNIRAALQEKITPNPARAQELRDLKAKYGTVLPKHYWPNMQVVNIWMCGNTNVYFQKIKDSFPETSVFHEFSYFSSECRAGVVLKSNTKDTVMFGHKVYFEFIPEEEIGKENPKILQLNEVEKGQRYSVVVTTSSGFYRYNMNDLVEVTGFYNKFPTISFIQKVNGIVSMTGEKLHERQFIEAVHAAEKETKKPVKFFVGFADVGNSIYHFYYEFADQNTTHAEAEEFTRLVDKHMMEQNVEYESKRSSHRVLDPKTYLLKPESFETFKAKCIDLGYRDGQFKLNLLMQDEKRQKMFKELVK